MAVLLLVKLRPEALPWGLSRLVMGTHALRSVPGLRMCRVLGSGREGGFGPAPGLDHQGLITFFDDEGRAQDFADRAGVMQDYRRHAEESLTLLMRASSVRGLWGGVGFAATARPEVDAPVAAITRASIRLRHAARFWRHAPATHLSIARAEGCRLAIGLGEAPLLRQATFSLWDSTQAMEAYAAGPAHAAASRSAWREGWFSESMFLRFVPLSITGQWRGRRFG